MSGTDSRKSKQLFERAIALMSAERSAYLSHACDGDQSLREEVEDLLRLSEQTDGPLDRPPAGLLRTTTEHLRPGDRLGRYSIGSLLGEGGMGVVYRARQEAPDRDVALKVIHDGLIGRNSVRRFAQEAAVLGRLRHPGIAAVIEASLSDGRPFIAMELVDGLPITQYAKERRLTLRDRLELVAKVCDALHHAHVKGVIHRDIKPANVLVDASGQPRVLDFGIARLTENSAAPMTGAGQMVGTLAYMSPEQTGADPSKVDARSDVYAVGVVLYELVCGKLPLSVNDAAVVDAVARIQSQEPDRPRQIDSSVPEDVDTIVMRALEKDGATRYQHASDLAADLRRFLVDEPILARPHTALYQLSKFARRNRVLVGATCTVLLAIIVALAGVTVAMLRARSAEAEAAEQARVARAEVERSQRISSFLRGMLSFDREVIDGRDTELLRKMLQLAEQRLPSLDKDPLTRCAILAVIGNSYRDSGYTADALRVLEEAATTSSQIKGPEAIDTLFARDALAAAQLSASDIPSAVKNLQEIAEIRARVDPDALRSAITLSNLAVALEGAEKFEDAIRMGERATAKSREAGDDENVLHLQVRRGWMLAKLGRMEEAETVLRGALDAHAAKYGWKHYRTIGAYLDWGRLLALQGRNEEAYTELKHCLELAEGLRGKDTGLALGVVDQLVGVAMDLSLYTEAEQYSLRLLNAMKVTHGLDSIPYWAGQANLAAIYRFQGRPEVAEQYSKAAMENVMRLAPEGSVFTGGAIAGHAETLRQLGKRQEEARTLELAWKVFSEGEYRNEDRAAQMAYFLADAYESLGNTAKSQEWADRAEGIETSGPPDPQGRAE